MFRCFELNCGEGIVDDVSLCVSFAELCSRMCVQLKLY